MPVWKVAGSYVARRGYSQVFSQRVEAKDAAAAKERAFSQIGGCHGVARRLIKIESVEAA